MKVISTKEEFLRHTYIGKKVFIIEVGKTGYTAKFEELKQTALLYDTLMIKGDDVFEQGKDISDFLKELKQDNPLIQIIIQTKPLSSPVYMGAISDVTYIIMIESCRVEGNKDKIYSEKALDWHINTGARFIFNVKDEDDYDSMVVLAGKNNIKKYNMYIHVISEDFYQYSNWANAHDYNLFIEFTGSWLGENDGEEETTE
jgi:hypothetical protein